MSPLTITRTTQPKPRVADPDLGFGAVFTDHMLVMDYTQETGWHDARIEPYGPLTLDPAALVLHYGQAVFEGFKAFRSSSGEVVLFRPRDHIARLKTSSARLCIPAVDEPFILEALKRLVRLDADWVPRTFGCALYVRAVRGGREPPRRRPTTPPACWRPRRPRRPASPRSCGWTGRSEPAWRRSGR